MTKLLHISEEYSDSSSFVVPIRRTSLRRQKSYKREHLRFNPRRHPPFARRVCLELVHPQARVVKIAGSFNDWRPGATWMISLGQGRWVKELLLPPGRYDYCFGVDGKQMPATAFKPPNVRGWPLNQRPLNRKNRKDAESCDPPGQALKMFLNESVTTSMNTIREVLRAPKHAYRQAESRHGKAQRHRHERRKVKEYMKLQNWQEQDEP